MPLKISGTRFGGTPARRASDNIDCSIRRRSSTKVAWYVLSSCCLRRSSSILVCSHSFMSSVPSHPAGSGGRGVDIDSGGGRRLSPDGGTRSLDELIIGFWVVGESSIEGQGSSWGRDLVFVLADSWVSVVTFVRLDGFEDFMLPVDQQRFELHKHRDDRNLGNTSWIVRRLCEYHGRRENGG